MTYASDAGDFSIALAGDCMLTRKLSVFDEPAFLALVKVFRDCDAGMANLETVVRRWDEGTPGITQGTFMTTPPELLEDIKWFGINMLACANNHAFDYGEGGLLATIRHLDAAGLAHAGSGRNLVEARMPGYLDTRGGRVAILAATATFRPSTVALQPEFAASVLPATSYMLRKYFRLNKFPGVESRLRSSYGARLPVTRIVVTPEAR